MIRPLPLAAAPSLEDMGPVVIPAIAVAAVVVALFMLLRWVKKRVRQNDDIPGSFTLSDLRRLVKEGKMSAEEFERAKNNILEAHKRATDVKPAQDTTTPKQFPPRV